MCRNVTRLVYNSQINVSVTPQDISRPLTNEHVCIHVDNTCVHVTIFLCGSVYVYIVHVMKIILLKLNAVVSNSVFTVCNVRPCATHFIQQTEQKYYNCYNYVFAVNMIQICFYIHFEEQVLFSCQSWYFECTCVLGNITCISIE